MYIYAYNTIRTRQLCTWHSISITCLMPVTRITYYIALDRFNFFFTTICRRLEGIRLEISIRTCVDENNTIGEREKWKDSKAIPGTSSIDHDIVYKRKHTYIKYTGALIGDKIHYIVYFDETDFFRHQKRILHTHARVYMYTCITRIYYMYVHGAFTTLYTYTCII